MTKLLLPLWLFLTLTAAHAVGSPESCPAFTPSTDNAKWEWMDRDCHRRTRADLDHILSNHELWLKKYAKFLATQGSTLPPEAANDPLHADLSGASLIRANLSGAILIRADLSGADLTNAVLSGAADLTDADLSRADLTNADLSGVADLSGADLTEANLLAANFSQAILIHAKLNAADLTGAELSKADLTDAHLYNADLSSTDLQETDFSDADLTLAKLWYADFEPKVPPPNNTIARTEGLQTLRWEGTFDELVYRSRFENGPDALSPASASRATVSERWMVWLSKYREIIAPYQEIREGQQELRWGGQRGSQDGKKKIQEGEQEIQAAGPHRWRCDVIFLWNDIFYGLQRPSRNDCPQNASVAMAAAKHMEVQSPQISTSTQGQYQIIDVRTALRTAGYSDDELQVNLAYQRHVQGALGMIVFDWTCGYGSAPSRPLFIALVLALLAVPLYWLGFRNQWFGGRLVRVESRGGNEIESVLGDRGSRPSWRAPLSVEQNSHRIRLREMLIRLRLERPSRWVHHLIAACRPRLLWEAGFLKAIAIFSLISIVNLGFEGLDFGGWVRLLLFSEYDFKPRGWLRTVSGLQSLIGLGLLALSLLSYFGHPFE
jgi:uncharacterized protein YjbI with pentapeptide repeats